MVARRGRPSGETERAVGTVAGRLRSVGRGRLVRCLPAFRALRRSSGRMRWRVTDRKQLRLKKAWAPATLWLWTSTVLTCGAVASCLVLAPKSGASPAVGLAWLLFLGSSVHVASTGWLFTSSDVRRHAWEQRGRYVW